MNGFSDEFKEVVKISELSNCLAQNQMNESSDYLICYKSDSYFIPDFCNVPAGSAISYQGFRDRHKTVLKGLALKSYDCTFTLAINITKHYEWINSVVFG